MVANQNNQQKVSASSLESDDPDAAARAMEMLVEHYRSHLPRGSQGFPPHQYPQRQGAQRTYQPAIIYSDDSEKDSVTSGDSLDRPRTPSEPESTPTERRRLRDRSLPPLGDQGPGPLSTTYAEERASHRGWKQEMLARQTTERKLSYDRNFVSVEPNDESASSDDPDESDGEGGDDSNDESDGKSSQPDLGDPRYQTPREPHPWDPFSVFRRC